MKLATDVTEVVLSNTGTTGEFRIRNSAKAFKILSDGLYSNKIEAIVRELSCNAVDSHTAAGKSDVPFEVHLPTVLEPWFSVRDFGVGLSPDQVENIYTTYFESTKTESNDFIGALGLGSKSPFSYTDNFSVTAIKAGRKCIYTAFINDSGVPSVTKMSDELSDEPTGLEVKFSVTDPSDFYAFEQEAIGVFSWFKLQPVITGNNSTKLRKVEFIEENIVPGIHRHNGRNMYGSFALMGNIAYPLDDIPEVGSNHFKDVRRLLAHNLVLEFDIGELDFAANREHLSYIPLTLNSIKNKLELLNENLLKKLANEADAIKNEWERSVYLQEKMNDDMYKSVVSLYVAKTGFDMVGKNSWDKFKLSFNTTSLKDRDIDVMYFSSHGGESSRFKNRVTKETDSKGNTVLENVTDIFVQGDTVFVFNDLNTGGFERTKYHFNKNPVIRNGYQRTQYVVYVSSKEKDLKKRQKNYDKFLKDCRNPPVTMNVSQLLEKEKKSAALSKQGIMFIGQKANKSYYDRTVNYCWRPLEDEIDDTKEYVYCELSNYDAKNKDGTPVDIMNIHRLLQKTGIPALVGINIHGVRQSKIHELKDRKNWIHFSDRIKDAISTISDKDIKNIIIRYKLDRSYGKVYINKSIVNHIDKDSFYTNFVNEFADIPRTNADTEALSRLYRIFGSNLDLSKIEAEVEEKIQNLDKQYPLMKFFRDGMDIGPIEEYINLIDKHKQEKN